MKTWHPDFTHRMPYNTALVIDPYREFKFLRLLVCYKNHNMAQDFYPAKSDYYYNASFLSFITFLSLIGKFLKEYINDFCLLCHTKAASCACDIIINVPAVNTINRAVFSQYV